MIDKQIIGIAAGVLTAGSLIPQLIKSLKEKKVDVAPIMFIVLFAGNGLWVYYGMLLKDIPIMVTNSFSVIMDVTLFVLRMVYRNKK